MYRILDNGRRQEDTSHEPCAYAGRLGITIGSPTKLSFTEGVAMRYEVDHYTYYIMGDGGLQWGHLSRVSRLRQAPRGRLIAFWDDSGSWP